MRGLVFVFELTVSANHSAIFEGRVAVFNLG